MKTAFYNEIDRYCCDWLSNLMDAGEITPGTICDKSIEDVTPNEVVGYERVHWFAGIGAWDAALKLANWRGPVWTASCPCQPFSSAGKGAGFADERHLWPALLHHIKHGKPQRVPVFGEQVASNDGLTWLDLVQGDMEAEGYAFWPFDLCAAGVGAPHIRQRLYFVADPNIHEQGRRSGEEGGAGQEIRLRPGTDIPNGLSARDLEQAQRERLEGQRRDVVGGEESGRFAAAANRSAPTPGSIGSMGDASEQGLQGGCKVGEEEQRDGKGAELRRAITQSGTSRAPGPVNGFWANATGVWCRHPTKPGKWELRPVEPGSFPLAARSDFSVGSGSALAGKSHQKMLHAYGNSIVRQVAATFIGAYMDLSDTQTTDEV